MKTLSFRITGTTPLLMHNVRLSNPMDKYSQRLAELHVLKKKKGADKLKVTREVAEVEWEGGLYHTETEPNPGIFDFTGPYIPARVVRGSLVLGARMTRGGAKVQRSVMVAAMGFPLEYDGPKSFEDLHSDKNYWDQRMVKVGSSKVLRTRPIFHRWSTTIEIMFDEDAIAIADLLRYLDDAARYHGYGDNRVNSFGRYAAKPLGATPALAK